MVEDWAYVLDFLPRGRPDDTRRSDPIAYSVGERNFVLLELVPRHGANMLVGDRVYLGRDPTLRESSPVDHVRGRVRHEEMTHAAVSELRFVVEQMVKAQEERFLKFYNEAGPITTRMHMLELLPGLGKKLMWAIVEERKRGLFKSFKEMDDRVKALHQPEKLIAHRIETEITDPNQKYHLFVQPPAPEEPSFGPRGPSRGPPRGPPR
ncbi:MAG TPA: DUF655 domain-containing protein [Candidatus Thermoplasmatota archaeon]|nr:DUF655 domain-containing protein [Candidatus Thermoplasmatota archaeon]